MGLTEPARLCTSDSFTGACLLTHSLVLRLYEVLLWFSLRGKQRVQMFNPHTVLFCNLFFDLTMEPADGKGGDTLWVSLCHLGMCYAGACFSIALPGYECQVSPEVLLQVRDQISKQHRSRME